MNVLLKPKLTNILLAIFIFGSIFGCSQIRQLTYPDDFTYLENKQVKVLMRNMDGRVQLLAQQVSVIPSSKIDSQQVINTLGEIEGITSQIIGGHSETNQLFISDHIEKFVSDVGTAKMFVKASPPNYSKAIDITNSCNDCHKSR